MFNWIKKQSTIKTPLLECDIHSHLLPGLDDGVKTMEEAISLIEYLKGLGYKRLITTPHIIADTYRNTPEVIRASAGEVKKELISRNIDIEFDAAAEYYLDEFLLSAIDDDQRLLTLKDKYLLFETNFLSEPFNLKEFVFRAAVKGYKPVLAHPERYIYLQSDLNKAEDLLNRGVTFQLNIISLTGYYSKPTQRTAYELIDRGWVHWLGSDCHHLKHAELLAKVQQNKYFKKALNLPLLNFNY